MHNLLRCLLLTLCLSCLASTMPSVAQIAPSNSDIAAYDGLLLAAHEGNIEQVKTLIGSGTDLSRTDGHGRTAVHIAAHASHESIIQALSEAGAEMNALENDAYDAVTIAAVANDVPMLEAALSAGNRAGNVTSRYDGTALIAAAHLGHHEVVRILIEAGAPLDHINNLNWTAVIEAIVLGDGGDNHQKTLRHLVEAGADITIADGRGRTPLQLAEERGYAEMIEILQGN